MAFRWQQPFGHQSEVALLAVEPPHLLDGGAGGVADGLCQAALVHAEVGGGVGGAEAALEEVGQGAGVLRAPAEQLSEERRLEVVAGGGFDPGEGFAQLGELHSAPGGVMALAVPCVRRMGRIWVESEAGRGSSFSFALPVAAAGG